MAKAVYPSRKHEPCYWRSEVGVRVENICIKESSPHFHKRWWRSEKGPCPCAWRWPLSDGLKALDDIMVTKGYRSALHSQEQKDNG